MRIDFTFFCWIAFLLILLWRYILKRKTIQISLHRSLGDWAVLLQWYVPFCAGIIFVAGYSLCEITWFHLFVRKKEIEANLAEIFEVNNRTDGFGRPMDFEEFKKTLYIPPALKWLSLASQVGSAIVIFVTIRFVRTKFIVPGGHILRDRCRQLGKDEVTWMPAPRMNWLITIITMPAVYTTMALRASVPVWAIVNGNAKNHFMTPWFKVEAAELAIHQEGLEFADFFQFWNVYAFSRLCGSFFSEHLIQIAQGNKGPVASDKVVQRSNSMRNNNEDKSLELAGEFRRLIRFAALLPVWAFIAVGLIRCLIAIIAGNITYYKAGNDDMDKIIGSAMEKLDTIFTGLTVLVVVNMFIISHTPTIKRKLGNANLKFMGVRLLLLIGEVQKQIINAFTVGSSLYDVVSARRKRLGLPFEWSFTVYQADLLHLSLLNLECLVVVILNYHVWRDLDIEQSGLTTYCLVSDMSELDMFADDSEMSDDEEFMVHANAWKDTPVAPSERETDPFLR